MASKKTKKRRDKKSRLSDKDILKLIKKLRPKNQQIVRVNVGDKADKKKGSTSAFQPNLVPVLTYGQPFQNLPPPPPAPPLPPPLPVSQQPQLQPLIFPPPAPTAPLRRQASLLLTDTEAEPETPVKTRKSRTSRKALETAEQGYSVQPARESRFKAPKGYTGSSLSASSSQPSYFQAPIQNDKFVSVVSFEDPLADEAGVVSQPLPSDEWTGTPQGELETETMAGSAVQEPLETVPAPEETFIGRPIGSQSAVDKIRGITAASAFAEEEPDWTKSVKLDLPPPPPAPSAASANPPLFEGDVDPFLFNPLYENLYLSNLLRDAPLTAQGLMKNEIVEKLKGGYTGVPKEYLTKTGRLKTKIPANELYNLYTSLK
jgi:hypothetical protein